MTIKELRQYRSICSEIDYIDGKLNGSKIHVRDSVQSASKHPYSLHNVQIEGDVYEHSSPSLLAKKHRLEVQKRIIEEFMEKISDSKIRRVIEIYCLDPVGEDCEVPGWNEIADIFADGSTGESIRKSVTRFLEKIS